MSMTVTILTLQMREKVVKGIERGTPLAAMHSGVAGQKKKV